MSKQPLREPAFLVLTALAGGPLHGYALVEDVLRLSDGQVRLRRSAGPCEPPSAWSSLSDRAAEGKSAVRPGGIG